MFCGSNECYIASWRKKTADRENYIPLSEDLLNQMKEYVFKLEKVKWNKDGIVSGIWEGINEETKK